MILQTPKFLPGKLYLPVPGAALPASKAGPSHTGGNGYEFMGYLPPVPAFMQYLKFTAVDMYYIFTIRGHFVSSLGLGKACRPSNYEGNKKQFKYTNNTLYIVYEVISNNSIFSIDCRH